MQALGCGLPGWRRAVQKLQADRKQLKQRLAAYSTEIAQTYALSLLPQLLLSNGWLHAHRHALLACCRRCRAHSRHQPILVFTCMSCRLIGCNCGQMMPQHGGQCGMSDMLSAQAGQHQAAAGAHPQSKVSSAKWPLRRRAQLRSPCDACGLVCHACHQAGSPHADSAYTGEEQMLNLWAGCLI